MFNIMRSGSFIFHGEETRTQRLVPPAWPFRRDVCFTGTHMFEVGVSKIGNEIVGWEGKKILCIYI